MDSSVPPEKIGFADLPWADYLSLNAEKSIAHGDSNI
jgi:hypothetical protein